MCFVRLCLPLFLLRDSGKPRVLPLGEAIKKRQTDMSGLQTLVSVQVVQS